VYSAYVDVVQRKKITSVGHVLSS